MALRSSLAAWRLCARHERTLAMRSRWVQVFAVLFGGLALAVATSGYVLSGGSGVQDFARTTASLVHLMLLIVPLAALVLGIQTLAGDLSGALLLFAQPVPRWAIMLGSIAGLFEALVSAQLVGFAAAGFVVFSFAGTEGIGGFLLLIAGSAATTLLFLGIAAALSVGSGGRRMRALGTGLFAWFALVLLYDIVLLAVATTLRSGHATRLLVAGVLMNPVDAARTGLLMAIEGTAAFGSASLAFVRLTGSPAAGYTLLVASVLLWTIATLSWAVRRLARVDL